MSFTLRRNIGIVSLVAFSGIAPPAMAAPDASDLSVTISPNGTTVTLSFDNVDWTGLSQSTGCPGYQSYEELELHAGSSSQSFASYVLNGFGGQGDVFDRDNDIRTWESEKIIYPGELDNATLIACDTQIWQTAEGNIDSNLSIAVNNLSTQTPPVPELREFSLTEVRTAGTIVRVYFSEDRVRPVDDSGNGNLDGGDWTFTVDGIPLQPVGVPQSAVGDSTSFSDYWEWNLPEFVRQNQTVEATYEGTADRYMVSEDFGLVVPNAQVLVDSSDAPLDSTRPSLLEGASHTFLKENGQDLVIAFDEQMRPASSFTGMTVTVDSNPVEIDSSTPVELVAYDEGFEVTLERAVDSSANISLSFDDTVAGSEFEDIVGLQLNSDTIAVENKSTLPPAVPKVLTYDLDGGEATASTTASHLQRSTVTLSDGAGFAKANHYLSAWLDNDNVIAGVSRFPLGASDFLMPETDVTLYAEWSQHTVCYDINDPNVGPTSTSCTAGQVTDAGAADYVVKGADTFTREGFQLVGWSKQNGEAAEVEYPVDTAFDLVAELNQTNPNEKTITLFAVWEEESSGSFSAPTPFDGPVITTDFSGDSFTVGQTVTISGTGLDGIRSVRFGDTEASVTANESNASFVVPDVEPGQYTLTIKSSNGSIGLQQQVTVLADGSVVIGDEATESKGWTSKLNPNEVKMYAKNIEVGKKYQFFVNGEEIAWVRKNSETDIEGSNLREALGTDYMVRTVELMPGKNALEVFIDGTRVWRAAYGG